MFSHVMIGTDDVERARIFYDALFAAIGGPPGTIDVRGRLIYDHDGTRLLVGPPLDGGRATAGNGTTLGFRMSSPEQCSAWHRAGTENGGRSVEDPPGLRASPRGDLFLAYLRDPDGNKLCGLYRLPAG